MRWAAWILICVMPARADDAVSACGDACPSRGIELVVVEEPVKLPIARRISPARPATSTNA